MKTPAELYIEHVVESIEAVEKMIEKRRTRSCPKCGVAVLTFNEVTEVYECSNCRITVIFGDNERW